MMHENSLKTWIHGASGRMGQELQKYASELTDFHLVGGSGQGYLNSGQSQNKTPSVEQLTQELNSCNYLIDFSSPAGNEVLFKAVAKLKEKKLRILIATTGLSQDLLRKWQNLQGHTILYARNTSLGVTLTLHACLSTFSVVKNLGFDVEIHESHHRYKKDAPSGTALLLAHSIAKTDSRYRVVSNNGGEREEKSIGLSYTRGGQVFGEHTVSFLGDDEEIRISHRALSRSLFAKGALILCKWLETAKPGFHLVENLGPKEFAQISLQ